MIPADANSTEEVEGLGTEDSLLLTRNGSYLAKICVTRGGRYSIVTRNMSISVSVSTSLTPDIDVEGYGHADLGVSAKGIKFREAFASGCHLLMETLRGVPWYECHFFGRSFAWLWRPSLGVSRIEDDDMRTALVFLSYLKVAQSHIESRIAEW